MKQSDNRAALVTGGATGIGAAITSRLAADGLHLFVVQRAHSGTHETFDDHPGAQRIHIGFHDLATDQGCTDAVAECVAHFGGVDVLVNNAAVTGAAGVGALDRCDRAQIDQVIDVNLKAPLRLACEALPYLEARPGVIVNISSVAEVQAQPEAAAYVASKGGVGALTRALGYDLGPRGIRVVSIAPGDVATAASRSPRLAAMRAHVVWGKHVPLGFSAEPDDIAKVVAWVISDDARYVTATTIIVDGGLTAY